MLLTNLEENIENLYNSTINKTKNKEKDYQNTDDYKIKLIFTEENLIYLHIKELVQFINNIEKYKNNPSDITKQKINKNYKKIKVYTQAEKRIYKQ